MTVAVGPSRDVPHSGLSPSECNLLDAVSIDAVRTCPALAYRLAMIPLLALILMLPLVYVALIVTAGWGVVYHAMHHTHWMTDASIKVIGIVLYGGVLLAGVLVVVFMVKPMFAPRPKLEVSPYALERTQEPLIFAFVERLADSLGAPAPQRIEISCEPNASASLGSGMMGLLSRKLTLTIGTPLIAAMNTRELAGIIAHELGHFAQGAGMRSTYLIHRINAWFAQVVFERDAWDEKLNDHARHATFLWTMVIAWMCVVCVWLSRRVLWLLMMISHAASCVMLRRMEFDADRKQIVLVGSETFVSTFRRIAEIDWAFSERAAQMEEAHRRGRLAMNLPTFIAGTIEVMPFEMRERVRSSIEQFDSRAWFESHPSTAERISHARAANADGVLTIEQPASMLLRNFEVICRWSTIGFYHAHLEESIVADDLLPTEQLLERTREGLAAHAAGARYYQKAIALSYLPPLDGLDAGRSNSVAKLTDALVRARKFIVIKAAEARKACIELLQADRAHSLAMQVKALRAAGVRFNTKDFELPDARDETIAAALTRSQERLAAARAALDPMNKAVAVRWTATLRLLERDEIAARLTERQGQQARAMAIITALRSLDDAKYLVEELSVATAELLMLLFNADEVKDNEKFQSRLTSRSRAVHELLQRVASMLRATPFPFDHSHESFSMAKSIVPKLPPRDAPGSISYAAQSAVAAIHLVREQSLDTLALIGEQVEQACGLSPLPEPSATTSDHRKSTV